jgi:signal transduction histidine kinase/CheY-like chemotaxis protein
MVEHQQAAGTLLDAAQIRLLERIAAGAELGEILEAIVRLVEAQGSGALCSILLLDDQRLRHGAAPSLPVEYARAVDGQEIGPQEGSCGAAAFLGKRVIAADILSHPNWTRYCELASANGLRACWASPIFSPQREVLGTFAIYHRAPREPSPEELAWVDVATHVAAIAIARDRASTAQRNAEARVQQLARLYAVSSGVNEALLRVRDPQTLYESACRIAVERGLAAVAWIGFYDEEADLLRAAASFGQGAAEYVQAIKLRLRDATTRLGPAARALGARTPAVSNDLATDPDFHWRDEALRRGLRSCAVFPLFIEGHPPGVFAIYGASVDFFRDEEVSVLSILAGNIAFAVESARAAEELRERAERLRFTHAINETIRAATDSGVLLRDVLAALGVRFHASRVGYAEVAEDGDRCFISDDWVDGCASIVGEHRLSSFGPKVTAALRGAGTAAVVRNVVEECGPEEQGAFAALEIGAFFCCALTRAGVPRAMMYIHDRAPRAWTSSEVALAQDVIERLWTAIEQRAAETKLRHSEAELRVAGQAAKVGGWSLELPDRKVSWSEQLYAMHEMPIGAPPTAALALASCAPEFLDTAKRATEACIRDGTPFDTEIQIVTATGKRPWVRAIGRPERDASGKIVRIRGALQDVDDRRRLEDQLRQSQKMDAIGQLAGGIAHDFNNILSVILSYASFIIDGLPPGDATRGDVEQIRLAGARATELTRQLLTFSRQQPLAARQLDLNEVLAGFEKMLRRLMGAHVSLVVLPGEDLGRVFLDTSQVEQVIMNLAVNARDAMPDGGTLTIETAGATLDTSYAAEHHGVTPGDYVTIAVTDVGHGMDAATRARIFEPFFTTKPKGKGTGIGLATVYGIVTQSGGHITVDSEPGSGTTFRVYFPRCAGAPGAEARKGSRRPPARRGAETVLVVEDDEPVRIAVRSMLYRAGYKVLEANNGADALIVSEQYAGRIHLLLTDVVMPRLSGAQLARRLSGARPEMRVLYMSGYPRETLPHGVPEGAPQVLAKPIAPDVLLSAVGEVLDASPASRPQPDLDARSARPAATRGERILHVDDEEALVLLTGRFLRRLGYRVTGFTDAREALRAFEAQPNDFDAVITDVTMHAMSGFDLVREVRRRRADMPVVVMSGYFRANDLREAEALGLSALLVKSSTVDELGQSLHEEIQRHSKRHPPAETTVRS